VSKVLFLDIDGVLTTVATRFRRGDPACVERLNRITDVTGAKIVVSSSWRGNPQIASVLAGWGVTGEVIGVTPDLSVSATGIRIARERGDEIFRWLCDNMPTADYVILDDDADMGPVINRLVRTDSHTGLSTHHADTAIKLLGSQP